MSKPKDAMIRNLRERVKLLTADNRRLSADAKRWKKRAAELNNILNMTDEDFFELKTYH